MQPSYTNFDTNGRRFQQNDNEDMGSFSRSIQYDNIDTRMSTMMKTASSSSPFGETHVVNRKGVVMDRNERLQSLVTEGVLRLSDVFLKTNRNSFLARLVPGTLSYYQRVQENSFLFHEYQSCSNDSEQQRIVQEIVESVWLNQGRFLVIDKTTNSVVIVDDQKLPGIIVQDLISPETTFPTLSGNGSFAGNKSKNNKKKRKITASKTKNYKPLLDKAINSGRSDKKCFKSYQTRQNTGAFDQGLVENIPSQNDNGNNNNASAVGQRGRTFPGSRPSRGGRGTSRRYTYRNKRAAAK
jgi:hypothetical protein